MVEKVGAQSHQGVICNLVKHIGTKISRKIAKTGDLNVRERGFFRTSSLDMLWFIVPCNITIGFEVAPVT